VKAKLTIVFVLLLAAGCVDSRIKRAANLNVVKAKVAQAEMKAAVDPVAKVKVAEQYFDSNIPLLEAVDEYMQGVDPDAKVTPVTPADDPK
jgi:hypothetical protein